MSITGYYSIILASLVTAGKVSVAVDTIEELSRSDEENK